MKIDAKGNYSGTEDFISGWLTADGTKIGHPVDVAVQPGGTIYISDDMNGIIYKVSKKP
jgi:glucose/arabinose dehydrogenase